LAGERLLARGRLEVEMRSIEIAEEDFEILERIDIEERFKGKE